MIFLINVKGESMRKKTFLILFTFTILFSFNSFSAKKSWYECNLHSVGYSFDFNLYLNTSDYKKDFEKTFFKVPAKIEKEIILLAIAALKTDLRVNICLMETKQFSEICGFMIMK